MIRNIFSFPIRNWILVFAGLVMLLSAGCISERPGVDAPSDIIHFPIGVAVHPSGHYAAVVNANFNQAYKNGSVVIIDLESYSIVPEWTLPVGTFAGEVIFNHAGTRMFVSVRGNFQEQGDLADEPADVVIAVDVDTTVAADDPGDSPFFVPGSRHVVSVAHDPFGLAIDANDRHVYVSHVSGGEVTMLEDGNARPIDEQDEVALTEDTTLRQCIPESLSCPTSQEQGELCGECDSTQDCGTTEYVVDNGAGGVPRSGTNYCLSDPRRSAFKYCAKFCEVDRSVLNESGEVVRLGCPEGYRCEKIRALRKVTERKLSRGGNQLAVSPSTGTIYVSHRDSNMVGILRPYYTEGMGYGLRVQLRSFMTGFDLRGLTFNNDGSKLFVAARNLELETAATPGVLILDTSVTVDGCDPENLIGDTTGCEKNRMIDFIEVDNNPANVVFINDLLYVPIYSSDKLYVINTRTRLITDIVDLAPEDVIEEVGIFREHARPYDIATYSNEAGIWALVSNFEAHEVAVIQLFDNEGNAINRLDRKIENRAKLYAEDQY